MANGLYNKLAGTVGSFIGEEKAKLAINRQLERCGATPDNLTEKHLREVMNFLVGATTLYLYPDKAKQQELTSILKALA